jgi:hypothetical protein
LFNPSFQNPGPPWSSPDLNIHSLGLHLEAGSQDPAQLAFNIVSRFSKLGGVSQSVFFILLGFLLKRAQVLLLYADVSDCFFGQNGAETKSTGNLKNLFAGAYRFPATIITKERIAGIFNKAF